MKDFLFYVDKRFEEVWVQVRPLRRLSRIGIKGRAGFGGTELREQSWLSVDGGTLSF